jgi:hypothetical protein
MEITKNGDSPPSSMVTTWWVRDDFANGRRRFKLYAVHMPGQKAASSDVAINLQHSRLAGAPAVVGEAQIEVPNLEVAKILLAGLTEMLQKQAPEVVTVKPG